MFDVLMYTDCAADQSVNGRTGFQVTAKSAGATPTDEEFQRGNLLHYVPISMSSDEWRTHPPTCIYRVRDDRYYLSRGISTGATLGGRPGNQFTETIVTSDPDSVLPLRPAQLASAPDWSLERPATREVPAWPTPLEIDPSFEVGALHELVARDPWASSVFAAVLTMVEQTQDESMVKLVIKHSDQQLVLRWIALLTRFLDVDAALHLEFRVYAENPLSENVHIVGAHPLLSPDLTVARSVGSGVSLLDLEARQASEVEPSPSARRHAQWFLSGDPYQALDAIEVSARWAGTLPPAVAVRAAEIACLGTGTGAPTAEQFDAVVSALHGLASAKLADELEAYGDPLVDVVASYPSTSAGELLRLTQALWAVRAAGDDDLAQSLALAALEWADRSAPAAAAWARTHSEALGTLVWPRDDARVHAVSLLRRVMDAAAPADLPAHFTLATALATGISSSELSGPIIRLADLWASDARIGATSRTWLHADAVSVELRTQLADAIERGDSGAIAALRAGEWDGMLRRPWSFEPSDPMSRWMATRALVAAGDPRERARILLEVQQSVPDRTWPLFLERPDGIDPDEAASWIRAHGTLDPRLGERVEKLIAGAEGRLSWLRRGGAFLDDLGSRQLTLTPGLGAMLGDHRRILSLLAQADRTRGSVPNRALDDLAGFGRLPALYAEPIAHALIECADIEGTVRISAVPEVEAAFVDQLVQRVGAGDPAALAGGLRLYAGGGKTWSAIAKRALDTVWDDASTQRTRDGLAGAMTGALADALADYEADQSKGRLGRGMKRAAQSIFKSRED